MPVANPFKQSWVKRSYKIMTQRQMLAFNYDVIYKVGNFSDCADSELCVLYIYAGVQKRFVFT